MALDWLKEILSGDVFAKQWFRKQYRLILMVAGMLFFYVYFGYETQRQQHRLTAARKQLEDTYFVKTTLHAELMSSTRQSVVARQLQQKGSKVKESNTAPIYVQ